MNTLNI